jgi:hypothetical protein
MSTTDTQQDLPGRVIDHDGTDDVTSPESWRRRVVQRLRQDRAAVAAFLDARAQRRALTGWHITDFTRTRHGTTLDDHHSLQRAAQRATQPATIASWTAIAVFGATGIATVTNAVTWRPETALHKFFAPDTALGGLITAMAGTPLLALMAWLTAYGLWLTTARDVARYAQHGRYAPWTRLALATMTTTGAWATYQQVDLLNGEPAAFLAAGAVLAAWRALAITTARQARHVRDLNLLHAHQTTTNRPHRTSREA